MYLPPFNKGNSPLFEVNLKQHPHQTMKLLAQRYRQNCWDEVLHWAKENYGYKYYHRLENSFFFKTCCSKTLQPMCGIPKFIRIPWDALIVSSAQSSNLGMLANATCLLDNSPTWPLIACPIYSCLWISSLLSLCPINNYKNGKQLIKLTINWINHHMCNQVD